MNDNENNGGINSNDIFELLLLLSALILLYGLYKIQFNY